MAQTSATQQPSFNLPSKGLITDVSPEFQPEGSYRFMLNGVHESKEGDKGLKTNELGNELCTSSIPTDYTIFGHEVVGEITVLFLSSISNGIIAKLEGCTYTELYSDPLLKFTKQVDTTSRVKNGCDEIVYFTEEGQPPRFINLNNLPSNIRDLKLFKDTELPYISDIQVKDGGGNIPSGVVQFALTYTDNSGNPSEFTVPSNPIPILDDDTRYRGVDGGTFSLDGNTSKSVDLTISNIDQNFDQISLYVLQITEGTQRLFKVEDFEINQSEITYTFTGIIETEAVELDPGILNQKKIVYDSAKNIEQADNKLLLGNLKEKEISYSELQQASNDIQVRYVTKALKAEDITSGPKSDDYYNKYRSLMRDEVYALGIEYIYRDGYTSPIFHIPGREKDKNANKTDINISIGNASIHSRPDAVNKWDSDIINSSTYPSEVKHLSGCPFNVISEPSCSDLTYTLTYDPNNSPQTLDYSFSQSGTGTITIIYKVNNSNFESYRQVESVGQNGTIDLSLLSTPTYTYHIDIEVTYTAGNCIYNHSDNDIFLFFQGSTDIKTYNSPAITTSTTSVIEYERWQVFNTAVKAEQNAISDDIYSRGELGYYEACSDEYPSDVDCNDNRIYPNGKIRHHKMPDTTLEPHFIFDDGVPYIITLGLDFNNIVYPDADIVSHRIYIVQRTDSTKTVIDKGILYNNVLVNDGSVDDFYRQSHPYTRDSYYTGDTVKYGGISNACNDESPNQHGSSTNISRAVNNHSFHSPLTKFRKVQYNPEFIKVERQISGTADVYSSTDTTEFTSVMKYDSLSIYPNQPTNRKIGTSAYVDRNSILGDGVFDLEFDNLTSQEAYVLTTPGTSINMSGFGDSFNYQEDGIDECYYVSIKRERNSLYTQLGNLVYIPFDPIPQTGPHTSFGGDTFISRFAFRKTRQTPTGADNIFFGDIPWFYVESEINAELRHSDDDSDASFHYFPKHPATNTEVLEFLRQDYWVGNHYRYNSDFSEVNSVRANFPLQQTFEYCDDCINEFPTRVAYSLSSFDEERQDNYTQFLAADYKDFRYNKGQINDLMLLTDNLYVFTENSAYIQRISPQEIQTDASSIFIGTGEFFQIKEVELVSDDLGYISAQNFTANNKSQHGGFVVNTNKQRVFMLSKDGIQELTQLGNEILLRDKLQFVLPDNFKSVTGLTYPHKNNISAGCGLITVYDDRLDRFIISKRDYEIIADKYYGTLNDTLNFEGETPDYVDKIIWNENVNRFQLITDFYLSGGNYFPTLEEISYENTDYFINHSFTLSYNPETKEWISFHSYLPHYIYSDLTGMYSHQSNGLWKHNVGTYQTFYGKKYPFILESVAVSNPVVAKIYDEIYYTSECKLYDEASKQWILDKTKTYTSGIFYNSDQSTGELNISLHEDMFIDTDTNTIRARNTEKLWSIHELRDYIEDKSLPMFTTAWDNIKTDYFIDKVPLNGNFSRSLFETERLRDKYLICRMIFNPEEDYKITAKIQIDVTKPSPR